MGSLRIEVNELHVDGQLAQILADQRVGGLPGDPAVFSAEPGQSHRRYPQALVVGDEPAQAVLDPGVRAGVTPMAFHRKVENQPIRPGVGQDHAGTQEPPLADVAVRRVHRGIAILELERNPPAHRPHAVG